MRNVVCRVGKEDHTEGGGKGCSVSPPFTRSVGFSAAGLTRCQVQVVELNLSTASLRWAGKLPSGLNYDMGCLLWFKVEYARTDQQHEHGDIVVVAQ